MINGTREQVTRGSDRLSLLYFDNYAMEFSDDNDSGEERVRDARERQIGELFSVTENEVGPIVFCQFRVEGHQRLSAPLYHFSFAFVATACLLSGWFNRRGQADRLVLAIGLMVAMQAMALAASNLATRNLALVPLIYLLPLVASGIGAWTLVASSFKKSTPSTTSTPA
jgi:lipopolysaccharide export system permease protein